MVSNIGIAELLILMVIGLPFVVVIPPLWRIFAKMGYPGALSLLMLVPLANVIMLLVLAFSEWPIEQELRNLRNMVSQWQRPTPPGGGNT